MPALDKAPPRGIVFRTMGSAHGPITRLVSPHDLGKYIKPFVFLDLFTGNTQMRKQAMGLHPHSGIGTVTVLTDGDMAFETEESGRGTLSFGGVEWAQSGTGMWHGKELMAGRSADTTGFQLWIALPPERELLPATSQYLEAAVMSKIGPAYLILGSYEGAQSPVQSPAGINYLMVKLGPDETWAYTPPAGHLVGWLAVAQGALRGSNTAATGELVVFEPGPGAIDLAAGPDGARFVLGSAVPHPHELHTGYYSIHTSPAALAAGEARIADLKRAIDEKQAGGKSAGIYGG